MWGNTVAKQNHVGKHCNNSQYFKEKKLRSKIDEDLFGKIKKKIHKKNKKNRVGKHCINS